MNGILSILPLHYDMGYIIDQSKLHNHYGYEEKSDGYHFVYQVSDHESVLDVIEHYETTYLTVLVPQYLEKIDLTRKEKVRFFSFNGIQIQLDTTTVANMTAAVVGLDRDPSREGINWQVTAGVFVMIPREVMYMLADAAFSYFQSCFNRAKVLTDQVLAATNISEMALIDINVGWPDEPVDEETEEPEEPVVEETDEPE